GSGRAAHRSTIDALSPSFSPTTAQRRGLLERGAGVPPGESPGGVSAIRIPTRVESTAVGSAGMSGRDDDEDDLPGMFATPAEELAYWRPHTIDGRRCKPLKPIPIVVREPDLRVTRWTPPEDPFADLSYAEWKDGMQRLPALYWDPHESLHLLMGRSWTPI